MRRRSGALHCDSQEDFMHLAEAAHNHIGIFYDEKMNKKIMHQFKSSPSGKRDQQEVQMVNPELSAERTGQDYRGFDFGLETDCEKEERQELERVGIEIAPSMNVALICGQVSQLTAKLTESVNKELRAEKRGLDLVIAERQGIKEKLWLFSKEYIDNQDSLVQLYLKRCKIVLEICDRPKLVRNDSCQSDEYVLSRFFYLQN